MPSKRSTPKSSPTDDADAFALLVADVYESAGVLRRLGERTAATEGQTQARWQVLSVISEGDWTVPMAADRLGTSRQAVQRIANELLDDGLVSFEGNPRHRRSQFLRITAEGLRVLHAIAARARTSNGALLDDVRGIDVLVTRSALQQLTAAARARLRAE